MPQMAAMGMEVAVWPRETPPTNMTASRPSRRIVMHGRMKRTHLPVLVLRSAPMSSMREMVLVTEDSMCRYLFR